MPAPVAPTLLLAVALSGFASTLSLTTTGPGTRQTPSIPFDGYGRPPNLPRGTNRPAMFRPTCGTISDLIKSAGQSGYPSRYSSGKCQHFARTCRRPCEPQLRNPWSAGKACEVHPTDNPRIQRRPESHNSAPHRLAPRLSVLTSSFRSGTSSTHTSIRGRRPFAQRKQLKTRISRKPTT